MDRQAFLAMIYHKTATTVRTGEKQAAFAELEKSLSKYP
jgi:hypothetical protein